MHEVKVCCFAKMVQAHQYAEAEQPAERMDLQNLTHLVITNLTEKKKNQTKKIKNKVTQIHED